MDNPILAALLEALNTHIDARIKAALDPLSNQVGCIENDVTWAKDCIMEGGNIANLFDRVADIEKALDANKPAQPAAAPIDRDVVREMIKPIVESQIKAAVEEAINDHCSDYDHDELVDVKDHLSNYDLDDFVLADDVESKVEEAVSELDVADLVRNALRHHVSLSISVD